MCIDRAVGENVGKPEGETLPLDTWTSSAQPIYFHR